MTRQEKIDLLLYRIGFIDIFPNNVSIELMKNDSTLSLRMFGDVFTSLAYDRIARTQLDKSLITQILSYKTKIGNRPFWGQSIYALNDNDFQEFFKLTDDLIIRIVKFINGHEFT